MRITQLIGFAPIAILLIASAACGPTPQVTQSPNPSAVPQPTNTPNPAGLCANNLIPVKQGATWTYTDNAGTSDSEDFTATFSSVRPDGFTVSVTSAGSPAIDQQWTCTPAGIVASSLGSGQGVLGLTVAGIQASLSTSNPTGVTLPANVQTGTKWPYGLDIAGSLSQGNLQADLKGNIATSMEAVGTESVTVPAGTFNAIKVQGTSTLSVGASYQGLSLPITSVINTTFWFAPGVGWIKSTESGNLLGTAFSSTTELKSYTIP